MVAQMVDALVRRSDRVCLRRDRAADALYLLHERIDRQRYVETGDRFQFIDRSARMPQCTT